MWCLGETGFPCCLLVCYSWMSSQNTSYWGPQWFTPYTKTALLQIFIVKWLLGRCQNMNMAIKKMSLGLGKQLSWKSVYLVSSELARHSGVCNLVVQTARTLGLTGHVTYPTWQLQASNGPLWWSILIAILLSAFRITMEANIWHVCEGLSTFSLTEVNDPSQSMGWSRPAKQPHSSLSASWLWMRRQMWITCHILM